MVYGKAAGRVPGRTEAAPQAKPGARRVISVRRQTTTRWPACARDVRRTSFGWRHARTVAAFADGRRQVLAAYDELRERTRAEGDAVALGGAFQETLTRHAVLLKQAETFRARPDDFAFLLTERGGIARKDLDAFEELHARARRHRRAATMPARASDQAGGGTGGTQQPKPELRQGELALEARPRRSAQARRYGDAGRGRDAVFRS